MKSGFVPFLRCPFCFGGPLALRSDAANEQEVREGALACAGCGRAFNIGKGIPDFLDPADETLRREIEGWHALMGDLPESLVPTMTALPYYPHPPWPETAPDFFEIFEHVNFTGLKVVDLGAGRTWSSRFLVALGRAAEVVAVDILTRRFIGLETAEIFFREDGIYFERIRGDVHRLPLVDGWADAVFSCASIHHSSDPAALIAEAWRVLRPGGVFVFVSEPSKNASIPERRPQNEETAHGINEHIYSFAEYFVPLRRQGFRARHLAPRSIGQRLLYRDAGFVSWFPPLLRKLVSRAPGRRLFLALARGRWTGPLIYRYANLPLTVIARKPA